MNKMERKKKISSVQKEILISAMENDRELLAARCNSLEGRITYKRKWQALVNRLNSCPRGVQKELSEWQKAWAQLKTKTKKKKLDARFHARVTGGESPLEPSLSSTDERIIALIGPEVINGLDIDELGDPLTDGNERSSRRERRGASQQAVEFFHVQEESNGGVDALTNAVVEMREGLFERMDRNNAALTSIASSLNSLFQVIDRFIDRISD